MVPFVVHSNQTYSQPYGGVLGPEGRGDLPFMLRHLLLSREAVRVCPIVPNTLQFAVPTPTGPSSPCHQVNVPSPTERVGDRPVEWTLNTLSGDSDGLPGAFPFHTEANASVGGRPRGVGTPYKSGGVGGGRGQSLELGPHGENGLTLPPYGPLCLRGRWGCCR